MRDKDPLLCAIPLRAPTWSRGAHLAILAYDMENAHEMATSRTDDNAVVYNIIVEELSILEARGWMISVTTHNAVLRSQNVRKDLKYAPTRLYMTLPPMQKIDENISSVPSVEDEKFKPPTLRGAIAQRGRISMVPFSAADKDM